MLSSSLVRPQTELQIEWIEHQIAVLGSDRSESLGSYLVLSEYGVRYIRIQPLLHEQPHQGHVAAVIELLDTGPEGDPFDADLDLREGLVDLHALQQYSFRPISYHLIVDLPSGSQEAAA